MGKGKDAKVTRKFKAVAKKVAKRDAAQAKNNKY